MWSAFSRERRSGEKGRTEKEAACCVPPRHLCAQVEEFAKAVLLPSQQKDGEKNIGTKHSEIAKFVGREVSTKFSEKKTVGKAEQTTYGDRKGGDGGEDGTHNDAN